MALEAGPPSPGLHFARRAGVQAPGRAVSTVGSTAPWRPGGLTAQGAEPRTARGAGAAALLRCFNAGAGAAWCALLGRPTLPWPRPPSCSPGWGAGGRSCPTGSSLCHYAEDRRSGGRRERNMKRQQSAAVPRRSDSSPSRIFRTGPDAKAVCRRTAPKSARPAGVRARPPGGARGAGTTAWAQRPPERADRGPPAPPPSSVEPTGPRPGPRGAQGGGGDPGCPGGRWRYDTPHGDLC